MSTAIYTARVIVNQSKIKIGGHQNPFKTQLRSHVATAAKWPRKFEKPFKMEHQGREHFFQKQLQRSAASENVSEVQFSPNLQFVVVSGVPK